MIYFGFISLFIREKPNICKHEALLGGSVLAERGAQGSILAPCSKTLQQNTAAVGWIGSNAPCGFTTHPLQPIWQLDLPPPLELNVAIDATDDDSLAFSARKKVTGEHFPILMRGDIMFPSWTWARHFSTLVGFSCRRWVGNHSNSSFCLFVFGTSRIFVFIGTDGAAVANIMPEPVFTRNQTWDHLLYSILVCTVQCRAGALIGTQQSLVAKQTQCMEELQKKGFPQCAWHFKHQWNDTVHLKK